MLKKFIKSGTGLREQPAVLPAPPVSIAFWKGYWLTLRPYLFFVSGASGLTGLALAPGLGWGGMLAGFLAFLDRKRGV